MLRTVSTRPIALVAVAVAVVADPAEAAADIATGADDCILTRRTSNGWQAIVELMPATLPASSELRTIRFSSTGDRDALSVDRVVARVFGKPLFVGSSFFVKEVSISFIFANTRNGYGAITTSSNLP